MKTPSIRLWRNALRALAASVLLLAASPAPAFDLFATHEVTVQFATPDGKPMAGADVRVFAPGEPNKPYTTGRTDADGKFEFGADRDGFWSAEAHTGNIVARVSVRVGGSADRSNALSPAFLIGGLALLLVIAVWYRVLRAKARRPR
jgi:hypothetical protein